MIDALKLALQYGPFGVLILVIALLILLHEKKDGRIVKNLKKNFDRIEAIEKKDIHTDGRFDNIDTKLENLKTGQNDIKTDVKTLINAFATKGMG